jgi:hypothetical protein
MQFLASNLVPRSQTGTHLVVCCVLKDTPDVNGNANIYIVLMKSFNRS